MLIFDFFISDVVVAAAAVDARPLRNNFHFSTRALFRDNQLIVFGVCYDTTRIINSVYLLDMSAVTEKFD